MKIRILRPVLILVILLSAGMLFAQSTPTNPAILYVSKTGLDSNTGLSWDQAKATIQGAVSSALSTGASIYVGDGNYTVSTEVDDLGKPITIYLGRGTYSTSLATPFVFTGVGSGLIGASTTDTSGATSSGTLLDYTGTSQVTFVTAGSSTSASDAPTIENLALNFGNATAGSNGVIVWGAQRATVSGIIATTMPGVDVVSDENEATGDGTTTKFTFTLGNVPIEEYEPNKPSNNRLTITANTITGTDQGDGTITGTGISSGTVEYSTGYITITFSTAPASGTAILASYASGNDLVALLSTRENSTSGIRTSPFGFQAVNLNGSGTTAKVLVQGEATGASGSAASYATDGILQNDDVAQFEINWAKNVTVIRAGTENADSSNPSPAFSVIENPYAFIFGAVCGSQTKGLSTYKSGTVTSYANGC